MAKKPFTAEQFTATEFDSAADKAKFANKLVEFFLSGFTEKKFTKWLYKHLSLHFNGHIAHYNQNGFYEAQFATQDTRERFLRQMVDYPCYGQPEYTWCDVERSMQSWYAENKASVDEALLKRMQAEQDAQQAERRRRDALSSQKTQSFRVAAKSENQGSFGHWGYIVVAEDGSAYELQRSGGGHLSQHAVGDTITVPLHRDGEPDWPRGEYEIAHRKLNAPADVVAAVYETQPT